MTKGGHMGGEDDDGADFLLEDAVVARGICLSDGGLLLVVDGFLFLMDGGAGCNIDREDVMKLNSMNGKNTVMQQ